ncbi:DUF3224 domain-containing protein [Marinicella sp. S1101]|uniref:DUF3224 domain-containing protein n=1 Tax=Marinicella marina TaxID=2996016 RepID=UPI002260CD9F|nr:DUF3224 domain-containing protein [Marinicella marina]MCX7553711.1 DUF3224 domain-containing protein [Marinicella marina]MDJ1140801.1 DUF3224 domain-containing protein [Marinicella marina]
MKKISGVFEVKMQPEASSFIGTNGVKIGRMVLNKNYQGELNATSQGEMLSAVTATEGSAGYVAIEQVSGVLVGKSGGFVLQHSGIMQQGKSELTLVVIPDSGSGELHGLQGQMDIKIENGVHFYDFEFTFK